MEVTFKHFLDIVASPCAGAHICAHRGPLAANLNPQLKWRNRSNPDNFIFPCPSEVPKSNFCLDFEYLNEMLCDPSPWIIASI